jgi:hypothetical protein
MIISSVTRFHFSSLEDFRINTIYLVCHLFVTFQVITAFRDPGFFNSIFPMLYEVSNQSVICKAKGSSSVTSSSTDGQSLY